MKDTNPDKKEARARQKLYGGSHERHLQDIRAERAGSMNDPPLRTFPGYPIRLGGTTKSEFRDLAWADGDLVQTDDGDLAEVVGAEALAQGLAIAILEAGAKNGTEAEAALRKAATDPDNSRYLVEIRAFRANDSIAEFDYVAVGYPADSYRLRFLY